MKAVESYRPSGVISSGGFGCVLRVMDTKTGLEYAIKVTKLDREDAQEQLLTEIEIGYILPQSNPFMGITYGYQIVEDIPQVYKEFIMRGCRDLVRRWQYMEDVDYYLILMEFIPGEPLIRFNNKRQLQTYVFGLVWGLQSAYILHGFVHNDLKPENVLASAAQKSLLFVDKTNNLAFQLRDGDIMPKIIDFGFSYIRKTVEEKDGLYMGTPVYAPPEGFREYFYYGKEFEPRTVAGDLWAVGKMILNILGVDFSDSGRDVDRGYLRQSARELLRDIPTFLDERPYGEGFTIRYMMEIIVDIAIGQYLTGGLDFLNNAPEGVRTFASTIRNALDIRYDFAYNYLAQSMNRALGGFNDDFRKLLLDLLNWNPVQRQNVGKILSNPIFADLQINPNVPFPIIYHLPPQ